MAATSSSANRSDQYEPLPPHRVATWSKFGQWDEPYFPKHIGIVVEEVRLDYARLRLPWRTEVAQPMGVMHGGALATLIDTVVVPAIGGGYDDNTGFLTLSMHVDYLGAVVGEDAIAEGWVDRRGRSVVFCSAEVRAASGKVAARGSMVYKLMAP